MTEPDVNAQHLAAMGIPDAPLGQPYEKQRRKEAVDHPQHYGGQNNPYEAIKVIEAWGLGFNLGNTVKYVSRAGKKDTSKIIEDLKKARWYLDREISNLEAGHEQPREGAAGG